MGTRKSKTGASESPRRRGERSDVDVDRRQAKRAVEHRRPLYALGEEPDCRLSPQASVRTFDAKYLTEALRRSGVLQDGSVNEVVVLSSRPTVLSRFERLQLSYDGAAGNAPTSVILKTGLPERLGNDSWDAGRQEVAFYTDVAAHMPRRLVPLCFDAAWNPETRAWQLGLRLNLAGRRGSGSV